MDDWVEIQSKTDYPKNGKLIIAYLRNHDIYHVGERSQGYFIKRNCHGKSHLKMESITAWKYLEPYQR